MNLEEDREIPVAVGLEGNIPVGTGDKALAAKAVGVEDNIPVDTGDKALAAGVEEMAVVG